MHGYQGRTNKDPDSCYSFWIGASIAMLLSSSSTTGISSSSSAYLPAVKVLQEHTDITSTQTFLLEECQQSALKGGGFSKLPDCYPDILHTFYSLCWLAMAEYPNLKPIDMRLGICVDKSPLNLDGIV